MRVEESKHERDLVFKYDATGNRILKIAISKGQNATIRATSYHRDAQGNVLSTEESDAVPTGTTSPIPTTREYTLYGSSRLGVFKTYALGTTPQVGDYYMTKTDKYYELTNHLGNVMAVLSDAKHYDHNAQHFTTHTAQAQDYMPFGMLMPGRKYTNTSLVEKYRYGFNSQESVDEISGVKNHYTAPYWEYDPRVVMRWNTDPVVKPHESPYAVLANNPIWFTDPNGADTLKFDSKGKYTGQVAAEGDHIGLLSDGSTFTFADQSWGNEFTTDEFPTSKVLGGDGKKFNSIFIVPNSHIEKTLEESSVNDEENQGMFFKYYFALTESRGVGKKMDYVNSERTLELTNKNPYSLFITDNKGEKMAHDVFNYGNFLWGAGMSRLKITHWKAVIGAHYDALKNTGELDSDDDQRSIKAGYDWEKNR